MSIPILGGGGISNYRIGQKQPDGRLKRPEPTPTIKAFVRARRPLMIKIKLTQAEFDALPHVFCVKLYDPLNSRWMEVSISSTVSQYGESYPVAEWAEIEIVPEEE